MKTRFIISFFCLFTLGLIVEGFNPPASVKPQPIPFLYPKSWPAPKPIFKYNKLTEEGFQLGKKLFYDGQLSSDGEVSCANCHQQFAAFSNYDHALSHGVNNSFSQRNAPALVNVAWMPYLHWDGAINHIELQPLAPITAPNEMGSSLADALLRLRKDKSYPPLFKAAFGDTVINSQRMLKALSQFVGSLVSCNSKYDKVIIGKTQFTSAEAKGYQLFRDNCSGCHQEPLFTDNSFRNNGQSLNRFNDLGLMQISQLQTDSLKFKVPTLRNIQVSAPYMHDGHVATLGAAIEHYNNGIDTSRNDIDPLLKKKFNFSTAEKSALIQFLYTLTDSSFLRNPRFGQGNPKLLKKHQ